MSFNFDALQKFANAGSSNSSDKKNIDRSKYVIPNKEHNLKVGSEIVFSVVWEHKHKVEEGHPFVPVVTYRLKDKNSTFGTNQIIPESSFDETLIDPVSSALENLKRIQEKNTGDSRLPSELWKSFLPTVYKYVPVILQGQENQGVKWLRLSPTALQSLTALLPDWYDETTGKFPDFKLKKSSQTSYDVNAYPPNKGNRAIDTIDKGILQDSLDNLPSLKEVLYVNSEEQIQKAIKANIEFFQEEAADETEISHGAQYKSPTSPSDNVDSNLKSNLDSIFG